MEYPLSIVSRRFFYRQPDHIVEVLKDGVLLAPFAAKFLKRIEATGRQSQKILERNVGGQQPFAGLPAGLVVAL